MLISRLVGLVIAVAGAGAIAFLWLEMADQFRVAPFIYRLGIPGVLFLGLSATVALAFGVHLTVAPRSAVKRWTPRGLRRS